MKNDYSQLLLVEAYPLLIKYKGEQPLLPHALLLTLLLRARMWKKMA